jgi:hypothetical protein
VSVQEAVVVKLLLGPVQAGEWAGAHMMWPSGTWLLT